MPPGNSNSRSSARTENKMNNQILVAYATKYGATAEIAEKIGQVLAQAGLPADVLPVDRVNDPAPYKAIVLGSAVYTGRWLKNAAGFLEANETVLAEKPVWLFSSGPLGKGDQEDTAQGWRFPKNLQPVADRIAPRDLAVFHGEVDMSKLGFIHKLMLKKVTIPVGDFRDWEAITSWAEGISAALKKEGLGQEKPAE